MDRAQLLNVATRLLDWLNSPPNIEGLDGLVSPDIVFPNPYPGREQGLEGLITVMVKTHKASPDVKMTPIDTTVDETESNVIFQIECTGTHLGLQDSRLKLTKVNGLVFREQGRNSVFKDSFFVR